MSRIDLPAVLTQAVHDPLWVVRDVLARDTLVILAGEPGVGKSVLSYHLAFCVASGLPFLGHESQQTRVLYVDEENSLPDFKQYCCWVWRGLKCPSLPVLVEHLRIEHFSVGAHWGSMLLQAAHDYQPGLIILDTATTVMQIKDENDNAEASLAIRVLKKAQVAATNQTAALVLKHAKIHEDPSYHRTIRGAKTWLGQVDGTWFHQVHPSGGRPRNDGLRQTVLIPDKIRAFGLRQSLCITPSWTAMVEPRGIALLGAPQIAKTDKT